ncbi:uncharacterized protein LOC142348611 isoform X2 [Convolutriloba macropyga]
MNAYYGLHWGCPEEFPTNTTVFRPLDFYKGSWYELYTFPSFEDEPACKCPLTYNTMADSNGNHTSAKLHEEWYCYSRIWDQTENWELMPMDEEKEKEENFYKARKHSMFEAPPVSRYIFNRHEDKSMILMFTCETGALLSTWSFHILSRKRYASDESLDWAVDILRQMGVNSYDATYLRLRNNLIGCP